MDTRGLTSKLRSHSELVIVFVICLVLVGAVGATSTFWRTDDGGKEYVLRADITTDRTEAYVWEEITFDANGSEGDIVAYLWDFGEGDVVRGKNITRAFEESAYYNVYLTVTDSKGDQDISMVNVSIYNENEAYETTGLFLDSAARRGPSTDGLYMYVYGGVTRPTVYVNFTGVTECAVLELDAYIGPEYYSETIVCAGNDLDVRLVFEDLEVEGYDWADMYIRCERGYITNYCLQMSIEY